jgi:hypothetical protein
LKGVQGDPTCLRLSKLPYHLAEAGGAGAEQRRRQMCPRPGPEPALILGKGFGRKRTEKLVSDNPRRRHAHWALTGNGRRVGGHEREIPTVEDVLERAEGFGPLLAAHVLPRFFQGLRCLGVDRQGA